MQSGPLPRPRSTLRMVHGALAYGTLIVALPLALIGGMALTGTFSEQLWLRVALPAALLLIVPLALADRLLPKEADERKPGLVRDVLAGSYCAAALLVLLAPNFSAEPLQTEAKRLDAQGWSRGAYLARWMAGPTAAPARLAALPTSAPPSPTAEPAPAEAPPDAASTVQTAVSDASAPAPTAEPATEEPAAEPADAELEQDPQTSEYSPAELFSTYAPAVVSITIQHHGFHSGGTGFFIDDQGTIATNHHVIEDAGEVEVKTLDGETFKRVELLVSDPDNDLALLRVDPKELGGLVPRTLLGDSESVRVGEPVSVIGNPLGLEHTLTNGIISARRVYEGKRYVQMSAPISPGNSGGPVFDRHGRVIAVSVATMYGGQNLNLAVPVSSLHALIADNYPNRRSFGASSW